MGVPLHPPPNRLTASPSAIAYYSRITLHSFNSAASQAQKTVVHQGLMGDLAGTAAVGIGRVTLLWKKKKTMQKLAPLTRKPFGLDLQKEDCVESVQKIVGDEVFFKWERPPPADVVTLLYSVQWLTRCRLLNPKCDITFLTMSRVAALGILDFFKKKSLFVKGIVVEIHKKVDFFYIQHHLF